MTSPLPRVSVVIPTALRRPALLERALASVRDQRGVDLDVVVVADKAPHVPAPDLGPDVRVVVLDGPRGGSAARNRGVAAARNEWVALLDDDDTWEPDKLARQYAEASRRGPRTIVSSRFRFYVDGRPRSVLPQHAFRPGDDVSEWAFCRRTPFAGRGMVQTSTILASAELLRECPFAERRTGQDIDWVLRATRRHGAELVQLEEPLARYYIDTDRDRVSGNGTWRDNLRYAETNPDLFTPASAAGLLLTVGAKKQGARRESPSLVRSAFRVGRPRASDLLGAAIVWLSPGPLRSDVRRLVTASPHA